MATVKKPIGKTDRSTKAKMSAENSSPAPRRRRWKLLSGLLVVVLLVWFAPAIVARTALRQQILPLLLPEFQGAWEIGTASLGWLEPIRLQNVTVRDKQDDRLLTVASLTSEKTLFELTTDFRRLGRFRIEQPELRVILRDDGSNIEDAFSPFPSSNDESSGRFACSIEVVDGTVEIIDKGADRRTQMHDLALSLEIPAEQRSPWNLQFSTALDDAQQAGHLKIALNWKRSVEPASSPAGAGTLEFESQNLRLDVLQPLWARLLVNTEVSGALASKVKAKWSSNGDGLLWSSSGDVTLTQLAVAAPDYLGTERLKLASLSTSGQFEYRDQRITLNGVTVDSDIGGVAVSGTLNTKKLSGGAVLAQLQSVLGENDYSLTAELDLARLAALFPKTLRIRAGTKITSGQLTLALASNGEQDARRWTGRVQATDITAENNGQRIQWEQPIEIKLSAHRSSSGPVIDVLQAQSDFLQLSASGTLQQSLLTAHCDLDRLTSELGRFVDPDSLRLAGTIQADFQCRLQQEDRVLTTGRLVVDGFEWHHPGGRPWKEKHLDANLSGTAIVNQGRLRRIENARLGLVSGPDRLEVEQLQPVELTAVVQAPLRLNLKGKLDSWLSRLRPWLVTDNWDVSGEIDLKADASLSSSNIHVTTAKVNLQKLHVRGEGLVIDEPSVAIETSGTWDGVKKRFFSQTTTLSSDTISARAVDASVQLRDKGPPEVSGGVAVRANLDRLIRCTQDASRPFQHRILGTATGQFKFSHAERTSRALCKVDIEKLVIAGQPAPRSTAGPQWQPIFQDGPLRITVRGSYDHEHDVLNVGRMALTSDALHLRTEGTVDELCGRRRVDLSGEVDYDAQKVVALFRETLGEHFQMTGRQTRTFSLQGPLIAAQSTAALPAGRQAKTDPSANGWPPELSGQTGLGWDGGEVFGMPIGAGQLDVRLKAAVLDVKPIDVTVGEGRLKLSPHILLNHTPMLLVLDEGPMIENVRFSPEQCQSWLKYVAPIMADATQIEGRFSINLSGGNVPLPNFETGDVRGVLKIHSAAVRSGPLVDRLVSLVRQIEGILRKRPGGSSPHRANALLNMAEQDVSFRMAGGRVHHQGLAFSSGNVVIRTSGSVGFDETLSLIAEVPIREEWLHGDKLLAGLKGHVLRIPIGGTLSRPQPDNRALVELARQIAGSAANRWIEDELGKQLKKLFQPKQK